MEHGLFRPAAITARVDRAFGSVLLIAPPSFAVATLGALMLLLTALALAWHAEFDRKETVRGYLVPDAGLVRVAAPVGGFLRERPVGDGDHVGRGAVLAVIAAARSTRETPDVDRALVARITERERSLRAQRDEERLGLQLEQVRIDGRVVDLGREAASIAARLAIERERAHLTERRLADLVPMVALGHVARVQYEQVNDEYLARRAATLDLERALATAQAEVAALSHERGLLETRVRARIAEHEARLAALGQERTEASARAETVIRAPVDGVLTALEVERGQQVTPGQPLFVVVPKGATMLARLLVPTRAAGFVQPGQPVRLRFEAFPYQRFGTGSGRVSEVPAAVVAAGESVGPLRASEPVYLVEVNLDSDAVLAYGQRWTLRSGMLLEADLRLARQRVLDLLLDPVRSLRGRL